MASNLPVVRDKVQQILAQNFNNVQLGQSNDYSLRHGSSRMFVRAWENGDHAYIALTCPLLLQAAATPELFKFVALHSDDYIFGHLVAREVDNAIGIGLEHVLLGDYLDDDELIYAVSAMLLTADKIDDELQRQFGGVRYHED